MPDSPAPDSEPPAGDVRPGAAAVFTLPHLARIVVPVSSRPPKLTAQVRRRCGCGSTVGVLKKRTHKDVEIGRIARPKGVKRLPIVLTRDEVRRLLARLEGTPRLVAFLLYGSGLRVLEALQLRLKDLDLQWARSAFAGRRAARTG